MADAATPMLRQYLEVKSRHKDCILFFRLGDFYEMFYEDAQDASRLLDLVLTSRGKDDSGKIPMCGIPYHSADNYIAKLIRAGRKVAICEQVEDPSEAKGIVRRDVIRVITSGTFIDDAAEARQVVALLFRGKEVGLAFTDTASGAILTNQLSSFHQVIDILSGASVHELVFPLGAEEAIRKFLAHPLVRLKNVTLSPFRDWSFEPERAQKVLCEHLGTQSLRGFGIEDLPLAKAAAGALLEYLKDMNKTALQHIDRVARYEDGDQVFISAPAHYGLELEALVKTLDRTETPMGRRLLQHWVYHPLKSVEKIRERQHAVMALADDISLQDRLSGEILKNIPDVEKALSRLSCGCASPKDLLVVRNALLRAPVLRAALSGPASTHSLLNISDLSVLRELLERAIDPDMPLAKNEGKVIRPGYHAGLDEFRGLQENGRAWLVNFQAREIRRSGINSLKVGFNRVFGYYIEVTTANVKNVPADYIRRQTLANNERFITQELKDYEQKILSAEAEVFKIEAELIAALTKAVLAESAALHRYCREIATVDALMAFSLLARKSGYVMPDVTDGLLLWIDEGRHPVVEGLCGRDFIPNDTRLDGDVSHLVILTGPNMAGKSTYIRQNAVIVIMAQAGALVPARQARIGVVDKIFTRIGAHDEISKGQSTFMVEMTEAADIVNNMTPQSLIILDEVGRGTSTYDGLSLAWAIAEHLASKKVRTLFATHFHELTLLAEEIKGVKNYNVLVKEWEDRVIFMHKIVPGGADDSYGIYVAKLAGMPAPVIRRARKILGELEMGGNLKERLNAGRDQLDLFHAGKPDPAFEYVRRELEALTVDTLTPVQAFQMLSDLKKKIEAASS
ncbi:MAG: DNA mismatch repair protein MutS [Candidatus Omnitrophica bacterium]|nr:DNA mismatch repair protein MutS [Candidatus Omnitrophota bacterium]